MAVFFYYYYWNDVCHSCTDFMVPKVIRASSFPGADFVLEEVSASNVLLQLVSSLIHYVRLGGFCRPVRVQKVYDPRGTTPERPTAGCEYEKLSTVVV